MPMYIVLVIALVVLHEGIKAFTSGDIDLTRRRKLQAFACGTCLFLYAALRSYRVGTDSMRYALYFRQDARYSLLEILTLGEGHGQTRDPIFHCFLKILSYFGDYQIMFVVIGAVVAIGFSYFVYKHSNDILLSFLMFVCLRIYDFTLSGLRQGLAMGIIWIGISAIEKKKPIRFILLVGLATLMHGSAFVFLGAYFVSKLRRSNLLLFVAAVFSSLNLVTNNGLFELIMKFPLFSSFAGHLEGKHFAGGYTTLFIFTAILAFAYFYKNKIAIKSENVTFYINMVIVGITFFVISLTYPEAFRIGSYYVIYIVALLPLSLTAFSDEKSEPLFKGLAGVLLIAQYLYIGPGPGIADYTFFWQV